MKKLFSVLLLLTMTASVANAATKTYSEAFAATSTKPMAMLIYAPWSGTQSYLQQFRKVQQKFGNTLNYVELDISKNDAKAYTEDYIISPKLPHIVLFRNSGKISKTIERSCAASEACTSSKIKSFLR